MIRKANECSIEYKEHMRDGDGTVMLTSLIGSDADLNQKGRLFSIITLNPGCSIGYHLHEGESELFYIIKGTACYLDGSPDNEVSVSAGDVTICPPGEGHGIGNRTDEVVQLVALILHE